MYSITGKQKSKLIGALMRERTKFRDESGTLNAEATRIGKAFSITGRTLVQAQELLLFDQISSDCRFRWRPAIKLDDLDGKRVLHIVIKIPDEFIRQDEVLRHLKAMGIQL